MMSTNDGDAKVRCLYLDTIGLLSKAYNYADLAYIGGGFGAGIHNILEPAVWGIPVLTGPKTKGVVESHELRQLGGVRTEKSAQNLKDTGLEWMNNDSERTQAGEVCKAYCAAGKGATAIIVEGLRSLLKN